MGIDRGDQPGAGDDPAAAQPGSRAQLEGRLGRLARSHPSFPHDSLPVGSDRRPERPRPLTDAEHAEHVRDIRNRLDKARANGLATDVQHTIDPAREVWSADRDAIHDAIIADLYARAADVPCERKAILAGGLAGAGKSTVLQDHAGIDQSQYLTLNPDEIKAEMARLQLIPEVTGLSPMEASALVHEESSYLARQLGLQAEGDGRNLIWDVTMSSYASTEGRINELRGAGYSFIEAIFVQIPVELSLCRASVRHREGQDSYWLGEGLGGRLVPEEVIRTHADPVWGTVNRRNFEALKPRFDAWSVYDNSIDGGIPALVGASIRKASRDE